MSAMNNIGIDDQTLETLRRLGVGWILAFFIVGATIFAASWLVGWQMRRIERILGRKPKPEDWDPPGSGSGDGDTGETPRG